MRENKARRASPQGKRKRRRNAQEARRRLIQKPDWQNRVKDAGPGKAAKRNRRITTWKKGGLKGGKPLLKLLRRREKKKKPAIRAAD